MLLPTGLSEHYCYLFFSEIVSFVGFLIYVVFKNDLCVSPRKLQWQLEGQNCICCCITSRASLLPAGLMAQ